MLAELFTVTTTLAAPTASPGAFAVTLVLLQPVTVATVPLKVTVLVP